MRNSLLMDDVHRIRQQITSSILVLVTGNQANFGYKLEKELAKETIIFSQQQTYASYCSEEDLWELLCR
ncbi:hypothetical protein AtNW77_Chr3g0199351 [Arabidopsis thaliana]